MKSILPIISVLSSWRDGNSRAGYVRLSSIFGLLALFVAGAMNAQISYSSAGSNYTQNFDNLYTTVPANNITVPATTLPSGWVFVEALANANTTLRNDNGSSGTGDTYLDGATNSNERALGSYASGSLTCQFGAFFTNNTGTTLTQFTLAYTGEQWKDGGSATAVLNTLSFAYAIGASSITTGTYVNVTNLDFTATTNNTSADVTKDGNLAVNRTAKNFTVTGISWPANTTLYIRWTDPNDAGNDDNLAVDDLTFSASAGASSPAIAATGTLATADTIYGTASANTTFTASGSNLTNNITINAPSGYEISQTAGGALGFATSQILAQSGGNVPATTIYVRLAATTAAGSYSGNITLSAAPASASIAAASSTVAPKSLTVSGAVANDKIYDGSTVATISGATAVGTVNGDAITLSGGGTFANKTAANGKPVIAALSISGTHASSYTLTQPTGLTANITKRDFVINSATGSNKVYDGNTNASITLNSVSQIVAGDDLTVSQFQSGQFTSPFVGTNISIIPNVVIGGVDAPNYNLVQPTGVTANITQKLLTLAGAVAQNKVFDGNTNAVIAGTLTGIISGDDVDYIGTGVFASSTVGNNIAVTSAATLVGLDAANYSLTQPTGLTANISAQPLQPQTITFNALSDVVYGDSPFNPGATASSGLTVTYTSSDTSVATISGSLVTIVGVGTTTITASQAGNGTYDSAPTVDQTLNVTPKTLTISGAVANNKTYDGNDNAVISGTLSGIVGADSVTLIGTGIFASSDAGTGIEVFSNSTLGGARAFNYTLTQPTGLFADITPKSLTVSGAVASSKVYDGNANATITGATPNGVISPDDVSVSGAGTFAFVNAGTGISVTATLVLSGADAGNYSIVQPSGLSANITPLALTISGLTANDKVYDAATVATLSGTAVLNGVLGSDDVTVSGTPTAIFNNKNAGSSKPVTVTGLTLSGAQAANYTVSQPTGLTANITRAFLTITGATAQDKAFDGTTAAVITGTLSGVIGSDVVTLNGTGTFASASVGNNITVTSTATLSGSAAANYTINPQPTGLTANITPGPTVLAVGDLSIIGFQLNSPDSFAFVTWVDLAVGTIIKFTDNGFLSAGSANATNNARGGENFVIWKNNGTIIPAGTVITIADSGTAGVTNRGTIVSGNLDGLSASGDNIFAYQGATISGSAPDFSSNTNPATFNGTILFGLYTQGSSAITSWITTGTAASTTSYLPSQLNVANGNIALGSSSTRGQYNGLRSNQVTLNGYKALVTSPANWTLASGAGTLTFNTTAFTLANPPTASVISGNSTICSGASANINIAITGGASPYTVIYSNGTSNFTVNNYVSGSNIVVSPTVNTTYTLISVTDANALAGTGNSGSAVITVNANVTYYADADGDNFGNPAVSTVTCNGAPQGYVTDNTDCNDADNTKHASFSFYVDADNDTHGAGNLVSVCAVNATTPPNGFALTAGDCNDANASVYQSGTLYTDADNDGYDNGSQTVCYGATVPAGYALVTNGSDCNDDNAALHATFSFYGDADGDAYGTGSLISNVCAANASTAPAGYSTNNTDCNDNIAAINPGHAEVLYNGVDDNCDGQLDEGSQLKTKLLSSVCGTTLASINSLIGITTITQPITMYRIKVTNGASVQIIEKNVPHFYLTELATYDYATTYSVAIELQRNGVWLGYYGDTCLVSSPAILASGGAAQVSPSQCGIVLARINTLIATTSLAGVTGYRFQVTNITPGASGSNVVQTLDRNLNWFSLNMLTQYNYGSTYRVEIAVKTNGDYSGFGSPCEVSSPAVPTLVNCGGTVATPSTLVSASSVAGVTQYRFQIVRNSDNSTTTIDRSNNYFTFAMVPGYTPGVLYNVRVAVMTVGTWSPFGDACQITSPGAAARFNPATVTEPATATLFNAKAYPNPFVSAFGLNVTASGAEKVAIKVYDMTGRLIDSAESAASEINSVQIGDSYPSGVYNVIVTQGANIKTLRIIKR